MTRPFRFIALMCIFPLVGEAAYDADALRADLRYFTDSTCSRLRPEVGRKDLSAFRSELLGKIAARMLRDEYDRTCRAAAYPAYPSPRELGRTLKIGDGFSRYEGITGMCLEAGPHVVFVGETHGKKISLLVPEWMRKPPEGTDPAKDPRGWGLHRQEIGLEEGLNIIEVEKGGNVYLSYFDDHSESAPEITVHFPTGKVNGYFDIAKHDNDDWKRLLEEAVSPILDARGKHIQVAYPVKWFKVHTGDRGVELIGAYDTMLGHHYTLMGLVKYDKIPPNRILARVNHNFYMFRDGNGVAYLGNKGTMGMVANPDNVVRGDPCWGFCHEAGHVLQMRPQITWGGMTEVSCNIFTMYTTTAMGNDSRIAREKKYAAARKNIIGTDPQKSYLEVGDVFQRLIPFWQLHLWFKRNGKPDFYADVMEEMRRRPAAGTGNDSIRNQFQFVEICCDAAKLDLTGFFEKWGFFRTGKFTVRDYGTYHYHVTPAMVEETRKRIAARNYPKPREDITRIED